MFESILLEEINADPSLNCRGELSEFENKELADSIYSKGLLQPIIVRPTPGEEKPYACVCGFSRYKAYEMLKRSTKRDIYDKIPCNIKEIKVEDAAILNLEENVRRKALDMMQEAEAVKRIRELNPGITQNDIARKIGQSRGWVQTRLNLLGLAPEIQAEAQNGTLAHQHIREMTTMAPERQKQFVAAVKDAKQRGVTFKKLEREAPKAPKIGRIRDHILAMQSHVMKVSGPGLAARCLSWASGEISDQELFTDLHEHYESMGNETYKGEQWEVPEELGREQIL